MKNKRMWLSKQFCGKLSASGFGGVGFLTSLAFRSKCMGGGEGDLEFLILLFWPPKCWDYILGIPHLIWIRGFLEFQ